MSIFEYDEEATLQYIREDEFAQVKLAGRLEGKLEGELETLDRINKLIEHLTNDGRTTDITKMASDRDFQRKLFEEYQI